MDDGTSLERANSKQLCFNWNITNTQLNERYRDFPYTAHPHSPTSLIVNICHQSSTFVTTHESTLTRHYHLEPKTTLKYKIYQLQEPQTTVYVAHVCMYNYILLSVVETSRTVWCGTLTLGLSLSRVAMSQLSDPMSHGMEGYQVL